MNPLKLFHRAQVELAKLALEYGLKWHDAKAERPQAPWVQAAAELIEAEGRRPGQNEISLRSGVSRPMVRDVRYRQAPEAMPRTVGAIVGEWIKRHGKGSTLPLKEGSQSLMVLAHEICPDVAYSNILRDLKESGTIAVDGDYATLLTDSYITTSVSDQNILRIVLHHASSVLHAALHNITNARNGRTDRFTQRVYFSRHIPKHKRQAVINELNAIAADAAERMRQTLRDHEDTSTDPAHCCRITAGAHVDSDDAYIYKE